MVTEVRQSEPLLLEGREVLSWRERKGEREDGGAEADAAAEWAESEAERCREGKRLAMVEAEKGAGWLSEEGGASAEELAELDVEVAEDVAAAELDADAPLLSSGREKGGG